MSAPSFSFQVLALSSGTDPSGTPWARAAGRAADGSSVAVTITRVLPFLYVKLAPRADGTVNEPALEALRGALSEYLDRRVKRKSTSHAADRWCRTPQVVRCFDYAENATAPCRYARLEFCSLEAHKLARYALSAPRSRKGGDPPLCQATMTKHFQNLKEFTLAEANVGYEHQVFE